MGLLLFCKKNQNYFCFSTSLSINIVQSKCSWYTFVAYTISWFVCLSVYRESFPGSAGQMSVWKLYCGKMADWIWMLFVMVIGVGQGMGVLDGGGDHGRGMGSFWGKCGASNRNKCGIATCSSKITLRSTCFVLHEKQKNRDDKFSDKACFQPKLQLRL